jgi:pimeloyl-ACP methyl ester carboxylesterase
MRAAQLARRVLLGTTAVGLTSAAYRQYAWARDQRRHPPPGELVDIGGRRLHLVRMGTGTPAVVIDASLGGSVLEWAGVQRLLADTTTVVTYDRAGIGWSDPVLLPTAGKAADDLHWLLSAAAIPPPYILVGHSMGGFVVRLFAARHPELLAGIVLAESSHADQWQRFATFDPWRWGYHSILRRVAKGLWPPEGLTRLANDLGLRPVQVRQARERAAQHYPPDLVDAAQAVNQRAWHAGTQELLLWPVSTAEVRAEAETLGDLPLTVITARRNTTNWPGYPDGYIERVINPMWEVLQAELAGLSTNSRRVVTDKAGHHVNRDEPELVARIIRELVKQARQG